ncbi:MAG: hypothetical protein H0T75_21225 [Rhizobiales bacterium]|nr:hypothetical protein [Hyphomicrobiales bacterium]
MIAAIFWLKTRAGWKETSVHEVGGRDGHPIQVGVQEPAREKLARLLSAIADRASGDTELAVLPPPARQCDRE